MLRGPFSKDGRSHGTIAYICKLVCGPEIPAAVLAAIVNPAVVVVIIKLLFRVEVELTSTALPMGLGGSCVLFQSLMRGVIGIASGALPGVRIGIPPMLPQILGGIENTVPTSAEKNLRWNMLYPRLTAIAIRMARGMRPMRLQGTAIDETAVASEAVGGIPASG